MKKRSKRLLFFSLVIVVAVFVVLNVLARNHAHSLMYFTSGGARTAKPETLSFQDKCKALFLGINIPRPASDKTPADLDPQCRTLAIDSTGGARLCAWYVDRGKATPLVILFHGYTDDKTGLLREARAFLELGASVLLVDFRGSGGSSESYTTLGVLEADDVAAVTRYARDNLSHPAVVLFGHSMGAAAILRAADTLGIKPDGVIIQAVFDTMLGTVRNRFKILRAPSFPSAELLVFWGGRHFDFNGFSHNPVEYAGSLTCPSLFMHGDNDPKATITEGRRVFDAVPGPKTFLEFNSVAHESYVAAAPDEWRKAVGTFITQFQGK